MDTTTYDDRMRACLSDFENLVLKSAEANKRTEIVTVMRDYALTKYRLRVANWAHVTAIKGLVYPAKEESYIANLEANNLHAAEQGVNAEMEKEAAHAE